MTIALIALALLIAVFELARGYAQTDVAPMPEPRKIDDKDERGRR